MTNRLPTPYLIAVSMATLFLLAAPAALADEPLDFDIYNRNECLTVWVDLSPCLSTKNVRQLQESIDLLLDCHVELEIPRRLFGSRHICNTNRTYRISYHPIAEDYAISILDGTLTENRQFVSLANVFQFLQDSVDICLASVDSLDTQSRYVVAVNVTAVTLTAFNIATPGESENSEESPVEYLFRQFLDLTNYGRMEYETQSRPFSLDDLSTAP